MDAIEVDGILFFSSTNETSQYNDQTVLDILNIKNVLNSNKSCGAYDSHDLKSVVPQCPDITKFDILKADLTDVITFNSKQYVIDHKNLKLFHSCDDIHVNGFNEANSVCEALVSNNTTNYRKFDKNKPKTLKKQNKFKKDSYGLHCTNQDDNLPMNLIEKELAKSFPSLNFNEAFHQISSLPEFESLSECDDYISKIDQFVRSLTKLKCQYKRLFKLLHCRKTLYMKGVSSLPGTLSPLNVESSTNHNSSKRISSGDNNEETEEFSVTNFPSSIITDHQNGSIFINSKAMEINIGGNSILNEFFENDNSNIDMNMGDSQSFSEDSTICMPELSMVVENTTENYDSGKFMPNLSPCFKSTNCKSSEKKSRMSEITNEVMQHMLNSSGSCAENEGESLRLSKKRKTILTENESADFMSNSGVTKEYPTVISSNLNDNFYIENGNYPVVNPLITKLGISVEANCSESHNRTEGLTNILNYLDPSFASVQESNENMKKSDIYLLQNESEINLCTFVSEANQLSSITKQELLDSSGDGNGNSILAECTNTVYEDCDSDFLKTSISIDDSENMFFTPEDAVLFPT